MEILGSISSVLEEQRLDGDLQYCSSRIQKQTTLQMGEPELG